MGASVLHEDAIYPARMANVPINIRNTNMPQDPGTMITAEVNLGRSSDGGIISQVSPEARISPWWRCTKI